MPTYVITYLHCKTAETQNGGRISIGTPRHKMALEAASRPEAVAKAAAVLRDQGHEVALAWAGGTSLPLGFSPTEVEALRLRDEDLHEGFPAQGVQIETVVEAPPARA